jgi:hypothetical protein
MKTRVAAKEKKGRLNKSERVQGSSVPPPYNLGKGGWESPRCTVIRSRLGGVLASEAAGVPQGVRLPRKLAPQQISPFPVRLPHRDRLTNITSYSKSYLTKEPWVRYFCIKYRYVAYKNSVLSIPINN